MLAGWFPQITEDDAKYLQHVLLLESFRFTRLLNWYSNFIPGLSAMCCKANRSIKHATNSTKGTKGNLKQQKNAQVRVRSTKHSKNEQVKIGYSDVPSSDPHCILNIATSISFSFVVQKYFL